MKSIRSAQASLSLIAAFGLFAGQANAEGFIQISVGGAFTEDADLDFERIGTIRNVEFEDSVSVDFGGGAFFSVIPLLDLGVQGSIGYSQPTFELGGGLSDLDFHLVPISILGMARVPLFDSNRLPHGLLQPYVGIGPSFLLSVLDVDGGIADGSAVGFDVGFDLRAGLNINLTPLLGIFVQYKRVEVDATLSDSGDDLNVDFKTDHVTAGLGFHF